MKRKLFILSSWIMLLLTVLASSLWVISYFAPGEAHYLWPQSVPAGSFAVVTTTTTTSFAYAEGRIAFGGLLLDSSSPTTMASKTAQFLLPARYATGTTFWNHVGFSYRSAQGYSWGFAFPFWLIHLLTLPLLAIWYKRNIRFKKRMARRGEGLCLACGYDLRGSEDRCPECGKPFLSKNRPEAVWVSWAFGLTSGQIKGQPPKSPKIPD
jgi:hypothetical protein